MLRLLVGQLIARLLWHMPLGLLSSSPLSTRFQFAIRVGDQMKRLLRLYHTNKGTLVIVMDGTYLALPIPATGTSNFDDWAIKETHYSIHPSPHLPEENLIHFKQSEVWS
jgi:hypothetical protein